MAKMIKDVIKKEQVTATVANVLKNAFGGGA